ncbi:hypothetical protein D3C72_2252190 [compost metagenome]
MCNGDIISYFNAASSIYIATSMDTDIISNFKILNILQDNTAANEHVLSTRFCSIGEEAITHADTNFPLVAVKEAPD